MALLNRRNLSQFKTRDIRYHPDLVISETRYRAPFDLISLVELQLHPSLNYCVVRTKSTRVDVYIRARCVRVNWVTNRRRSRARRNGVKFEFDVEN